MLETEGQKLVSVNDYAIEGKKMGYPLFMARFYNFCKSQGMEAGKIMPSRAFCSDENQGYPILMIAKHFGVFPFNHGRVGGIVATDRHEPHAGHGQDVVVIQASHVGYDPDTKQFGVFRRPQTADNHLSPACGKVCGVCAWYQKEYQWATENILLEKTSDTNHLTVPSRLLEHDGEEGLYVHLDKMIEGAAGQPVKSDSNSKTYVASSEFVSTIEGLELGQRLSIGKHLAPDYFYYRRNINEMVEGPHHLELNLIKHMPVIVSSAAPALVAAQINSQVEFDRARQSFANEESYKGKNLVFISGVNIDISPREGQPISCTEFVPWAAYIQKSDGLASVLQQDELFAALEKQSPDNPDQIDIEQAIQQTATAGGPTEQTG